MKPPPEPLSVATFLAVCAEGALELCSCVLACNVRLFFGIIFEAVPINVPTSACVAAVHFRFQVDVRASELLIIFVGPQFTPVNHPFFPDYSAVAVGFSAAALLVRPDVFLKELVCLPFN